MSYVNLKAVLADAREKKYAVGAFNIVDYSTTSAIIKAAERKKAPVIIQTSVKTVKLYGFKPIVGWVRTLSDWSSVMIDASSFPLNENIRMTREVVKMAEAVNVTVEGELGAIV